MLKSQLFWSRYIELVIALVAFGWFVAEPSWEPITVFIGALATFVFCEIKFLSPFAVGRDDNRPQAIKGHQNEDRALYDRLTQLLPSDGIIDFIRRNNMAGFSFSLDRLNPLHEFIDRWDDATHEFLDPDLEHARSELYSRCREYSSLIAKYTFPNNNGEQSVPPEWETEQPLKFDNAVKELHDKAQEIVDSHERLVRMARRRLNL
jgi:hypothetical protein